MHLAGACVPRVTIRVYSTHDTHKFKARVNKMAEQLLKIPKDLFKNVKFYLAEEGNEKV